MIITAFDLATRAGVCDGQVGGKPRAWLWDLSDAGMSRPARLHALYVFLNRYFLQEECDAVVYEEPLPVGMLGQKPGKRGMMVSEANVALARGLIGVLEMACFQHSKPVEGLAVMDARSSVLGWRTNPSKTLSVKQMVVRDVAVLGVKHQDGSALEENESDAWVLWQYACFRQSPALAVASTPLFAGSIDRREEGTP